MGRYYLGVQPTKPGYEEYEVRPVLGDLDWMEGSVPTPHGLIRVTMNREQVKVLASEGQGWLVVGKQRVRILPNVETVVTL